LKTYGSQRESPTVPLSPEYVSGKTGSTTSPDVHMPVESARVSFALPEGVVPHWMKSWIVAEFWMVVLENNARSSPVSDNPGDGILYETDPSGGVGEVPSRTVRDERGYATPPISTWKSDKSTWVVSKFLRVIVSFTASTEPILISEPVMYSVVP